MAGLFKKLSLVYKATACPIKSTVFSYNSKYLTKSEKGCL